MATQRLRSKLPSALSAEQKVAFALLMFLGLGGVAFGAQSFGSNLGRPVQEQIAKYYTGEAYLTQDERDSLEFEASKSKDTDGDGLVDYDELYVYKTSPYLEDSDSDGYADQQEIFSGNNPNCPVGKSCGFLVSSVDEQTLESDATASLIQGLGEDELLEAGSVTFDSEEDIQTFFKQATIDQIRASLIEAGMSQEELDQLDDETLENFFTGVVDAAAESGQLESFVTPTP